MAVSGVNNNPAPKVEPTTKNTSKEAHDAEVERVNRLAKEAEKSRADEQLSEIGTNVNIAV